LTGSFVDFNWVERLEAPAALCAISWTADELDLRLKKRIFHQLQAFSALLLAPKHRFHHFVLLAKLNNLKLDPLVPTSILLQTSFAKMFTDVEDKKNHRKLQVKHQKQIEFP
jgi:hypothetical protein